MHENCKTKSAERGRARVAANAHERAEAVGKSVKALFSDKPRAATLYRDREERIDRLDNVGKRASTGANANGSAHTRGGFVQGCPRHRNWACAHSIDEMTRTLLTVQIDALLLAEGGTELLDLGGQAALDVLRGASLVSGWRRGRKDMGLLA